MLTDQRGSAILDAIVGIVILMLLTVGTIQVALTVYASNAIRASVYEAARAAAAIDAVGGEARSVARRTLERAAGRLVSRVRIEVTYASAPEGRVVVVEMEGRQRSPGPVPITLPVRAAASALLEERPD